MGLSDIIPGKEIYQDAFSPAMKQLGGMLESTMKVARFFAAPVEYVGAFQDRWQRYLKKISDKVPEENLVEGHPQIIVPSIEGLILTTEGSLLSELFINLLAKSVDKTQQEFAHPAFPNIIREISHDEAVILYYLKKKAYKYQKTSLLNEKQTSFYKDVDIVEEFPIEKLQFPKYLWLYNNHLNSLRLAGTYQVGEQEALYGEGRQTGVIVRSQRRLDDFGFLFAQACIPDEFENL